MKIYKREEIVTYKLDKPCCGTPIAGKFIDGDPFLGIIYGDNPDMICLTYHSFVEYAFIEEPFEWEKIKSKISYWIYLENEME